MRGAPNMTYPTHDTSWTLSAKGNHWRRVNGEVLIVGKGKNGRYWARRGEDFLPGSFASIDEAKHNLGMALQEDGAQQTKIASSTTKRPEIGGVKK